MPSNTEGLRPPEPLRPVRSGRVTPEASARLPRQDITLTRADLIDGAERIVNEYCLDGSVQNTSADPLPFLRLEDILEVASELARERLEQSGAILPHERVAPLTPGAFYKAFFEYQSGKRGETIKEFHRLIAQRFINQAEITAEPYLELTRQLHDLGLHWTEVIRLGVETDVAHRSETPAFIVMHALAMHIYGDDEIAEWTHEQDKKNIIEVTKIYDALLPLYNRQMRAGLTSEQLALAISDLATGIALRSRSSPEKREPRIMHDADGNGEKEWHLAALAALAIYEGFTEPIK